MDIDIESNLRVYLPSFFELMGNTPISWKKINKRFHDKLTTRLLECEKSETKKIIIEASFFDVISSAISGHSEALLLFDCFNKVLEELDMYLSAEEKKLVARNIKSMLTTLDGRYKNFLGELLVANQFVKRGYKIIQTEEIQHNGKRIDFKIQHKITNNILLVEVLNIQPTNGIGNTDMEIEKFFSSRLNQKNEDKGYDKEINHFFIVPVMWGTPEETNRLSQYYKSNSIPVKNSTPIACYLPFTDKVNNKFMHVFGTMDSIDLDKGLNLSSLDKPFVQN